MCDVNTMYPASGLGLDFAPIKVTRVPSIAQRIKLPQGSSSSGMGGMGNLALVGAVAGVGLLAYLAAKALK